MSVVLATGHGAVTISDGALGQLVVQAAESVDGARVRKPRRHLEIAVAEGRARVELELAVAYGHVLPEVARAVQVEVTGALRRMCRFEVDAVDVSVEELDR